MNRQDIIAMAREANMNYWVTDELEKFAKLVIKNEREAIVQLFQQPHVDYCGSEIEAAIRARGK